VVIVNHCTARLAFEAPDMTNQRPNQGYQTQGLAGTPFTWAPLPVTSKIASLRGQYELHLNWLKGFMGWFTRSKAPKQSGEAAEPLQLPDDIWTKCPKCEAILYTKDLRRAFGVCPKCSHHFRLTARQRIPILIDRHSFLELDANLRSTDPLNFKDKKRYKDRIRDTEFSTFLLCWECSILLTWGAVWAPLLGRNSHA
jgi:hypothetical protein